MAETTTLSVRISAETKERLARLAKSTKRSQAFLAAEAIDAYVDLNEWQVAGIDEAVKQADAGGPFVGHEDMTAWLESWGTETERSVPKATFRRK